jgi:hypothetical protein
LSFSRFFRHVSADGINHSLIKAISGGRMEFRNAILVEELYCSIYLPFTVSGMIEGTRRHRGCRHEVLLKSIGLGKLPSINRITPSLNYTCSDYHSIAKE